MDVRVTSGPITKMFLFDIAMPPQYIGVYGLLCRTVALLMTVSAIYLYFNIDESSPYPLIFNLIGLSFVIAHMGIGLRTRLKRDDAIESVFVWSPSLLLAVVALNALVSVNYIVAHSS